MLRLLCYDTSYLSIAEIDNSFPMCSELTWTKSCAVWLFIFVYQLLHVQWAPRYLLAAALARRSSTDSSNSNSSNTIITGTSTSTSTLLAVVLVVH